MSRMSKEDLKKLCEKLNVDRLWSYSRVSCFQNCKLEYRLNYIDKLPRGQAGFYGWFGSLSHDIKQNWLEGKITFDDMIMEFIDKTEWYKAGEHDIGKPPGTRGATSEENRDKLFSALEHYFINTIPMEFKQIKIEPFVLAKIGDEYFQGYIDELIVTKDNKIIILDDKTSSASGFSGKKLKEKAAQLFLYTIALMQMKKIPVEKISIQYDMMRYLSVCFVQKNGKTKKTKAERQMWVGSIQNRLEKELVKEFGYDETDAMESVAQAVRENSLESLPKELRERYWTENHYIEVPLTKEILKEYYDHFKELLTEIREFEANIPKKIRGPIEPSEEFYCNNLCDMRHHCDWYNKAKNEREQEQLFAEATGSPFEIEADPFGGSIESGTNEVDLSEDDFFASF